MVPIAELIRLTGREHCFSITLHCADSLPLSAGLQGRFPACRRPDALPEDGYGARGPRRSTSRWRDRSDAYRAPPGKAEPLRQPSRDSRRRTRRSARRRCRSVGLSVRAGEVHPRSELAASPDEGADEQGSESRVATGNFGRSHRFTEAATGKNRPLAGGVQIYLLLDDRRVHRSGHSVPQPHRVSQVHNSCSGRRLDCGQECRAPRDP